MYGFGIGATGLTYLGQAVGSICGLFIILYVYKFHWSKASKLAKQANSTAMIAP